MNKQDHHPKDSDLPEAIECPHCGRWLYEDKQDAEWNIKYPEFKHMRQVNFDKDGGYFFISNKSHNLRRCRRNHK